MYTQTHKKHTKPKDLSMQHVYLKKIHFIPRQSTTRHIIHPRTHVIKKQHNFKMICDTKTFSHSPKNIMLHRMFAKKDLVT